MGLAMRFNAALLALLVLTCSCQKESEGEKEIIKSQAVINEAIETHDAGKLASLCSDDAAFVDLTSKETIEGKANIENYLKKHFQAEEKPAIKTTIEGITFPESGKAIETGVLDLTYKSEGPRKLAFKADFAKVNNSWYLQKWTQVEMLAPPSHFEHLKDLDWLVGKWVNTDEDLVFTSHYRWDKSKNFLTQHFTLKVLDHKQLSGKQIIGWDPIKQQVRSWVFDSEGGFGENTWSKNGNSWYLTAVFTLSDGQRATATHIITQVDDKTYTFASVGRDIDGRVLPNIGPFKVVKQG